MAIFKKMFDQSIGGKGVLKNELTEKFTLLKFFRLTGRKIWRIAGLNILFTVTNLPIFFILLYFAGYGTYQSPTPMYPYWFGPITGAARFVSNPAMSVLQSVCGITVQGSYNGTWSYIFLGLALLTLFTFGPANAGMAFVLRNYTREEPAELFHDYFRTIGKNLRQSIIIGFIDLVLLVTMGFDFYLLLIGSDNMALFAVVGTAASIIYTFMRNYLYTIMITFDLSVYKIFKNSLIFAFVNVKRNLVAMLGKAICIIFTVLMLVFVTPIGALILMGLFFSFTSFIGIYAAYPAIKQYMIDPVINEERKKNKEERKGENPIFTDMG